MFVFLGVCVLRIVKEYLKLELAKKIAEVKVYQKKLWLLVLHNERVTRRGYVSRAVSFFGRYQHRCVEFQTR